MKKYCKACGAQVPNDARFCQNCGGSEFNVINDEIPVVAPTVAPTSAPAPAPAPVQNQNWQQPVQPAPSPAWQQPAPVQPKKKKTGLIIGIIVAVVAFILGFVLVIGLFADDSGSSDFDSDSGYNDNYDREEKTTEESPSEYYEEPVSYTKGTFDGYTYSNEWAGFTIDLPSGYTAFSDSEMAQFENYTTDYGFYFTANDTSGVIYAAYENLNGADYDEYDYMDILMSLLESQSGAGATFDTTGYATTTEYVAGEYYVASSITGYNAYSDFVQRFYLREVDGYMVCITIIAIDDATADELINSIEMY